VQNVKYVSNQPVLRRERRPADGSHALIGGEDDTDRGKLYAGRQADDLGWGVKTETRTHQLYREKDQGGQKKDKCLRVGAEIASKVPGIL